MLTRENEVSIELIAFVSGDVDRLVDFLKSRVPGWMIPHQVHRLPALPLTPNGKIDHQALFKLLVVQNRSQELQPFSENDTEAALRCLLRYDNFYPQLSLMENGGDSLTAIRMLSAWPTASCCASNHCA
ncbi:Linear gramicidin synthase subunit B [Arsenophonus endosymbiont of Aleurodicus floccissimus]|nr:Linear gramicidin synthase subunit B [Arsenophonus endosymbiont of Aleurodicus floccissimus]